MGTEVRADEARPLQMPRRDSTPRIISRTLATCLLEESLLIEKINVWNYQHFLKLSRNVMTADRDGLHDIVGLWFAALQNWIFFLADKKTFFSSRLFQPISPPFSPPGHTISFLSTYAFAFQTWFKVCLVIFIFFLGKYKTDLAWRHRDSEASPSIHQQFLLLLPVSGLSLYSFKYFWKSVSKTEIWEINVWSSRQPSPLMPSSPRAPRMNFANLGWRITSDTFC